jgi:hypothetical protein
MSVYRQEAMARQRRREMLAQARCQRVGSNLAALRRAGRRAARAERQLSRARSATAALRGSLHGGLKL